MFRWVAIAAAFGFGAAAGPAIATDGHVSFMSLPFYEIVDLAGGRLK
jgi:hypothetical protein